MESSNLFKSSNLSICQNCSVPVHSWGAGVLGIAIVDCESAANAFQFRHSMLRMEFYCSSDNLKLFRTVKIPVVKHKQKEKTSKSKLHVLRKTFFFESKTLFDVPMTIQKTIRHVTDDHRWRSNLTFHPSTAAYLLWTMCLDGGDSRGMQCSVRNPECKKQGESLSFFGVTWCSKTPGQNAHWKRYLVRADWC